MEEILFSPMTKALILTEKSNGQSNNINKRHQEVRLHSDCGPTEDGQLEQLQSSNWCG